MLITRPTPIADMTSLIYHKLYFKITRERFSDAKLNERSIKILSENPCPWIKIDLSDEIFFEIP
jgi:hypothetical protein